MAAMAFDPLLLQVQVELPQHNPTVVFSIIGGIVVIIVVFAILARRGASRRARTTQGRFNRSRFRRLAHDRGLTQLQTKTLENIAMRYRPSAPMSVFASRQALDITLAKAIEDIKKQNQADQVKEGYINNIYRIKQALEQTSGTGQALKSTNQLQVGQEISITPEDGVRYSSTITGKLRNSLAAKLPVDEGGTQVRWPKHAAVEVFLNRGSGKGYAFQTKVVGYSVVKGIHSVLLQHSNAVSAAAQRKFPRKELDRPAYFYAIQIMTVGNGRNAKKQAVPQTKGALGTMLDVSAGGCAVKSTFPLPKGSLIKVEFETERRRQIAVYGKVKSVQKAEPMGGIMHVMFTRISRKNLNRINSFIYDIG